MSQVCASRYIGKERDTESGLDYFGARYYASSMGRWMSPDWADKPEAVPYSHLDNPQSLNLYGYVNNNPLRTADPDGHEAEDGEEGGCCTVAPAPVQTPTASDWQLIQEAGASALADVGSIFAGALATPFVLTKDAGNWNDDHPNAQTRDGRPPSDTNPVITSSTADTKSLSGADKERASNGKAPMGDDGKPMELHHDGQDPNGKLKEMTHTEHRGGDNFKKNHPNTGQQPSKIDRKQFRKQREKHWKDRSNQ